MEILDGPGAEVRIRRLLSKSTWARIAVAYWGGEAIKRLGLDKLRTKDVQIVCDLRSGGCDPEIIKDLREIFGVKSVRTNDRLHAKLWLADQGVVFGSSNASSNGFGKVGKEASGLIEINAFTDDEPARDELRRVFDDEIWRASRVPLKTDFSAGEEAYDLGRRNRTPPRAASLLEALIAEPENFEDRDIFVWSWPEEDLSKEEKEVVEHDAEVLNVPDLSAWFLKPIDAEDLQLGAIVLEFDCAKGGAAKYDNAYQVLLRGETNSKGIMKVLCRPVPRILGLKLGDLSVWEAAAARASARKRGGEWGGPISKFARGFLGAK